MKKRIVDLQGEKPLLDIAAYARKGRLPTPAERLHISLTVRRAPEVIVKVSGGARTLSGVERHMAYIGREGRLGLDVDSEGHIGGKGFERELVRDWDLDVDVLQNHTRRSGATKKPPKLVHNIIFSMPPGTSPRLVLRAVQKLALDEWALRHRYAMALHMDNDHPHVHVVLKAVSQQGNRLNIRKATLRSWRARFAANLREFGVNANATERAVRGLFRARLRDGAYRENLRQQSLSLPRNEQISLTNGETENGRELGKARETQDAVSAGWQAIIRIVTASGDKDLARDVSLFRQNGSRLPTDYQSNFPTTGRGIRNYPETVDPPTK